MSDASPPSWVKRAPGLSAAHKFMLGVLWGYGPYAGRDELWMDVDGDRQPRQLVLCWESCAELARLTDQPEATVRNQLRKLAADGWILRGPGSMRTLAWREPRRFAYGAMAIRGQRHANDGQAPATGDPGHEWTAGDHGCIGGVHERPAGVATGGPQTLQEHSNSTSRNTPGAGAPEDTSGPDGGPRSESHDQDAERNSPDDSSGAGERSEAGRQDWGPLIRHAGPAGEQADISVRTNTSARGSQGPSTDRRGASGPHPREVGAPDAQAGGPGDDRVQRRRGRRDDPGDGRGDVVTDARGGGDGETNDLPEPAPLRLLHPGVDGDAIAELRALHERLRVEALALHGKPRTKLPAPCTAAGKAMDRDIRRRFAEHGLDVCRAVLAWRSSQWTRRASDLRYSRGIVWETKGFELALANMDAQPGKRPTRPAGLAAAPATLPLVPRELGPEEMGVVL